MLLLTNQEKLIAVTITAGTINRERKVTCIVEKFLNVKMETGTGKTVHRSANLILRDFSLRAHLHCLIVIVITHDEL